MQPEILIERTIGLEAAPEELMSMGRFDRAGMTVINRF